MIALGRSMDAGTCIILSTQLLCVFENFHGKNLKFAVHAPMQIVLVIVYCVVFCFVFPERSGSLQGSSWSWQ